MKRIGGGAVEGSAMEDEFRRICFRRASDEAKENVSVSVSVKLSDARPRRRGRKGWDRFRVGDDTDRMAPNSIRRQLRLDKEASLLRLPSLPGKAQGCDKYTGKPVGRLL